MASKRKIWNLLNEHNSHRFITEIVLATTRHVYSCQIWANKLYDSQLFYDTIRRCQTSECPERHTINCTYYVRLVNNTIYLFSRYFVFGKIA